MSSAPSSEPNGPSADPNPSAGEANGTAPDQRKGEAASADATLFFPTDGQAGKQEADVVLAAELSQSGLLSERRLSAALEDWSVHGVIGLEDHLRGLGVLSGDQLEELGRRARRRLASRATLADGGSKTGASGDSLSLILARHDDSGRVARLLGVSVMSGAVNERGSRRSPARYELVRKLGQGGLGSVWLARDTMMQRLVALKEVTNAGQASEATLARFQHEAEITGRLEHPGIVPIYQLGDDEGTGNAFYTMRFLGKETLQHAIAEHHERREAGDSDPMRLRDLLTAFVSICHAVGHAHSRKVIHRDLKPENVVIDSFGQVIVIDWGLAKLLDEAVVERLGSGMSTCGAGDTMDGQVLGTPLYMAPEQAAGRLDEVDTRTDIYGLGGILFAIITGRPPHEHTQTEAAKSGGGGRALITAIVGGPTPDPEEAHPGVDPALAAIAKRAMARRRYARYQTASELADDVQRWMADEPVAAYPEPPLQRAKRWIGRHQRLSQVIASLAAILVAAMVTLGVSARQAAVAAQQARFEQMRGDAREVELQLRSSASNLSGDARFMASLPPIQGIVRARAEVDGEDSEAVWRGRLEKIFTGLLRSEPEYLAIGYAAANEGAAEEIVRVERNVADRTLLRALPASRLRSFEADPFLAKTLELEPGDTCLSFDPRPWQTEAAAQTRLLKIAVPIYSDLDGEPFGMVVIETDIVQQLERILDGIGRPAGDIYITDSEGVIASALTSADGFTTKHNGRPVAGFVPGVASLYAQPMEQRELEDGAALVAKLQRVHPTDPGCGIVVTLPAGE